MDTELALPLDTDIHCDSLDDADNLGAHLQTEFPSETDQFTQIRSAQLPPELRLKHLNKGIQQALQQIVRVKTQPTHTVTPTDPHANDVKIEAILKLSYFALKKLAERNNTTIEVETELLRKKLGGSTKE